MIWDAVTGFAAGCVATAVMSFLQLPFWRANGLEYVLEWHENVGIVKRLFKKISEEKALAYSFFFHFLNGGLAAAAYNIFLNFFELLNVFGPFLLGCLFGIFLWVFTLAPIHRPLTGLPVFGHPLGAGPIVLSVVLHMLYGVIVTVVILYA
jgi:hypothetical protein